MKNLEKNKLETLLQIMGSNPSLRISHFTDNGTQLVEAIHNYCLPKEYQYQVNCIEHDFYNTLVKEYENAKLTKVKEFPLQRRSYMTQGKQYDFMFVSANIDLSSRDDFLKKAHGIILNAGNIIIFVEKNNYDERYKWVELLEETYFVATNTIDDLFENYDIVISKKMHGWGDR